MRLCVVRRQDFKQTIFKMKKREFIYIGGIIFLILFLFAQRSNHGRSIESKNQIIEEKNSVIETVQLKNGNVLFEKNRVESDLKSLKEGYSFLEDSLEQMGIKAKHLRSALFLAQQTTGSGEGRIDTVKVVENDTIRIGRQLNVSERFFNFSANIFPNNQFDYQYSIFDSLSIVNTSSRKNIFSPREYKVNVVNSNPRTELTGVTSLTIKEDKYNWIVGIGGGYGLTQSGTGAFIGIVVARPIIRLK